MVWFNTLIYRRRKTRKLKQRPTRKAPHAKRNSKSRRKRVKRFRSTAPGRCVVQNGAIIWTLPRKLKSPNQIRSGLARYGDTKGWEREIEAAVVQHTDLSLGPCSKQRLRLEVVRLAPNERFFLDRTNLAFSVKGLEDALVRLQYLVDDNQEWEDGPWVTQAVSEDGKYWTIIKLLEPQDIA